MNDSREPTTQYHGNSAEWVGRESFRRYPLDLAARLAWIRTQAEHSVSEPDRHAIYRLLDQVRNGV